MKKFCLLRETLIREIEAYNLWLSEKTQKKDGSPDTARCVGSAGRWLAAEIKAAAVARKSRTAFIRQRKPSAASVAWKHLKENAAKARSKAIRWRRQRRHLWREKRRKLLKTHGLLERKHAYIGSSAVPDAEVFWPVAINLYHPCGKYMSAAFCLCTMWNAIQCVAMALWRNMTVLLKWPHLSRRKSQCIYWSL